MALGVAAALWFGPADLGGGEDPAGLPQAASGDQAAADPAGEAADAPAPAAAPQGSTQIGPLAVMLPAEFGPWEPLDEAALGAAATTEGITSTGVGSANGQVTVTVIPTVQLEGNLADAAQGSIDVLEAAMGQGELPTVPLTWEGTLPSHAVGVDFGAGGGGVIVYIQTDDALIGMTAMASSQALSALTTAALSAVYTG